MLTKEQLRVRLKGQQPTLPDSDLDRLVDTEFLAELQHDNLIRDVEIFATGTHNGDVYTEQDLDDMVSAFKELDFKPALKIGHTKDKVGGPAYGYIENLRKLGTKLLADFSSMHDSVVEAIRKKSYNRVSSEIYFNFKRGEKVFRRALKAVALLGAEVPAVANLVPLHKVQFSDTGFEKLALATESDLAVENESIVAALSERVTVLTTLMKEFDMKTAAQVKEEIRKLNEQLAALKTEGGDKNKAKIAEFEASLAALNADVKLLEQAETAATENAALRATVARLQENDRRREVVARVAALTIPAFAPAMTALFTHALSLPDNAPKLAVYSKKDNKDVKEEKTLAEVCDFLLATINEHAKKTFKVFDDKGGRRELPAGSSATDNPGEELDRLASDYLVKHPELKNDYVKAFEQVCLENADLAKRYEESQNPKSN